MNNNQRFDYAQALALYRQRVVEAFDARNQRLGGRAADELKEFVYFLDTKTSWLGAPASTKFHMAVEGGLLIHSVGVMETAIELRNLLMPTIPIDSVIICGLFHDVGKVYHSANSMGGCNPRYKPNILQRASGNRAAGQQSEAQPYKYNEEDKGVEISLTVRDALFPMRFMHLSDAELQALMLADGQYVDANKDMAHKEHPLGLIVHYADYWNGHVIEGAWKATDLSGIIGRKTTV